MHTYLHTYSTHRYTEKTSAMNNSALTNAYTNLATSLDVFKKEVDTMYLLICGTLVVFSKYQLPDL